MLDNRTFLSRTGLGFLQRRLDEYHGLGQMHFSIEVAGKRIGYCYLRKNGCSSFKKMFLDLSPPENDRIEGERPIDFMRRHHCMSDDDFAKCDRVILVYRDPISRFLSMFRNKFIARNGSTDIERNFKAVEHHDAGQVTFRYLVETYLRRDFRRLDKHVMPQFVHLRRAVYTDVFPVERLHEGMTGVLGPEIADRYYKKPVNRTSDIQLRPLEGAADLPVHELREIFLADGYMPDQDSLLQGDLLTGLRQAYAKDYDFINRFSTLQQ